MNKLTTKASAKDSLANNVQRRSDCVGSHIAIRYLNKACARVIHDQKTYRCPLERMGDAYNARNSKKGCEKVIDMVDSCACSIGNGHDSSSRLVCHR